MSMQTLFFDLDGTLLRDDVADGIVRRVAAELAEAHGVDATSLAEAIGDLRELLALL